jgi:hypothetical protein
MQTILTSSLHMAQSMTPSTTVLQATLQVSQLADNYPLADSDGEHALHTQAVLQMPASKPGAKHLFTLTQQDITPCPGISCAAWKNETQPQKLGMSPCCHTQQYHRCPDTMQGLSMHYPMQSMPANNCSLGWGHLKS